MLVFLIVYISIYNGLSSLVKPGQMPKRVFHRVTTPFSWANLGVSFVINRSLPAALSRLAHARNGRVSKVGLLRICLLKMQWDELTEMPVIKCSIHVFVFEYSLISTRKSR